jgi:hypothetical protein
LSDVENLVLTSRGLARALLGVPLAVLVIMLSVVSARNRQKLEDLRGHGISTTGSVVAEECADHGEVGYRFLVDSKEYRGAGFCPLNCGAATHGGEVPVIYDGRDPDTSICEPLPQALGRVQRFFRPVIVGGIVVVGAIFWLTRRQAPRIVKAK